MNNLPQGKPSWSFTFDTSISYSICGLSLDKHSVINLGTDAPIRIAILHYWEQVILPEHPDQLNNLLRILSDPTSHRPMVKTIADDYDIVIDKPERLITIELFLKESNRRGKKRKILVEKIFPYKYAEEYYDRSNITERWNDIMWYVNYLYPTPIIEAWKQAPHGRALRNDILRNINLLNQ